MATTTFITTRKIKPIDHPEMTVEESVVNELLLVCGVIGSSSSNTSSTESAEIVPVSDCLNWLQDLQRALRRDNDQFRPISILVGGWKVVQHKLLPLVLSCRYDPSIVITILKILVILTKPMGDRARRAAKLILDVKSGKTEEGVVKEQIKLRDNALKQSELLMEYKRLFVHHPSHVGKSKKKRKNNKDGGLLSIFVSLLAEPLSRTGASRTDADHMTIELVLHLFRNLLCAEPIIKASTKVTQEAMILHHELICLFERELVLEILTVLSQDMEASENSHYNLLVLEILHHLFRDQDPTLVAKSHVKKQTTPNPAPTSNLLRNLQNEKKNLRSAALTRHSNFGGTLRLQRNDGTHTLASAALHTHIHKNRPLDTTTPSINVAKRASRNATFIGSVTSGTADTTLSKLRSYQIPTASKAERVLHKFVTTFVKRCYGPLVKTLKNEFRRESARLEDTDYLLFYKMVWFFMQWYRVALPVLDGGDGQDSNAASGESHVIGQLIFSMDVFSFTRVITSIEIYFTRKKYAEMALAVSLYKEMMHCLYRMRTSDDETERLMGLGLMEKLFYGNEPIEKFGKLISWWKGGRFTREYMCNLVELGHVSLKLLDFDAKEKKGATESKKKKRKSKKDNDDKDAVSRILEAMDGFEVSSYFSKIVSNQIVFMYTKLLGQYKVNTPQINHHIIAFFIRLCKFVIVAPESDSGEIPLNTVTLEPMLYNFHTISVFSDILNDDDAAHELKKFTATIIRHYATMAEKNPLMFVETLFRHAMPHRFCALVTNRYVDEELVMMGERDRLLREEMEGNVENGDKDDGDDRDNVEEWKDDEEIDVAPSARREMTPANDDSHLNTAPQDSPKGTHDDNEDNESTAHDDWNSRHIFKGKRKRLSDAREEEDPKNKFTNADLQNNSHKDKKRLRKTNNNKLIESDDESEDNLHTENTKNDVKHLDTNSSQLVLDDDMNDNSSHDVLNDMNQGDASSVEPDDSTTEKKRLRKAKIVDDESDDDDEFKTDNGNVIGSGSSRLIFDDDDDE